MTYSTRDITEAEHALVYSSYIRSSHKGGLAYREHCDVSHGRMERILRSSNLVGLALVDDESPGWVGGWLVGHAIEEGLCVHYVYVKRDYRRLGMAQRLLADARGIASGDLFVSSSAPTSVGRDWADRLAVAWAPLSSVEAAK